MASVTDSPVQPGDILAGKYRVERVLGMGNMGIVVAAMHVDLGELVALKLMLAGKATSPEQRERFLREARAAVRLKSHHVARVLDVGTHNESPYIVMEFMDGDDLAQLLRKRKALPIEEAVEYVLQACEAVGEAHAAGIVHRDLKPANLFLTEDVSGAPCVKVLDFGISKLSGGNLTLTHESQALGSPLYMPPEQMTSSKGVDSRSDIWALGIILYELVAGQTPFNADTIQELFARVLFAPPLPLSDFRRDIAPGFEAVILRCLERDRERRFQTVAELAAALMPYAPARARIYSERIARVLGGTKARVRGASVPELPSAPPAAPAPEPPLATPPAVVGSASGAAAPAHPVLAISAPVAAAATGSEQPPLRGAVALEAPVPAPQGATTSPPVPAPATPTAGPLQATMPLAASSAFPPPLMPGAPPVLGASSPSLGSETSLAVASSQNTSAPMLQAQPAKPRSRAPLAVAGGIFALAVPVALFVAFRAWGPQGEPPPAPAASTETTLSVPPPPTVPGETTPMVAPVTASAPPPPNPSPPPANTQAAPSANPITNAASTASTSAPLGRGQPPAGIPVAKAPAAVSSPGPTSAAAPLPKSQPVKKWDYTKR